MCDSFHLHEQELIFFITIYYYFSCNKTQTSFKEWVDFGANFKSLKTLNLNNRYQKKFLIKNKLNKIKNKLS